MSRYLFVLGSNWRLSLAELDHLLKYSHYKGRIIDYSANVAIVEFDELEKTEHYINDLQEIQYLLGGCLKIAKIYDFINISTIKKAFPVNINKFSLVKKSRKRILKILDNVLTGKREKIFPKVYKNFFYAVSIYPNFFDDDYYKDILVKHFLPFLNKKITKLLKKKGAEKAVYFKYPMKNIKSGNLNPIFPHHVIQYELFKPNRADIVFGFTEEGLYIGRTFTTDNPNFKKKLDEKRPSREFKSSIPPKLAKIMLNFLDLFHARHTHRILDPFVGNGTILMFAIMQDFRVYGSDIDEEKVRNTIKNLNWLVNEIELEQKPDFSQLVKNVGVNDLKEEFKAEYFDGICTEPSLGPYYTEKPYYPQAEELREEKLEPLYKATFQQAKTLLKPKSRIVVTAPIIHTIDGGEVQLSIGKIAEKEGFVQIPLLDEMRLVNKSNKRLQFDRSHYYSMIDAKAGQVISRKIFIFEKK
ncbi:MAG: TRM11 family SAM-dependent methyltransferase [Promethearchaeia archaeon]